MYQTSSTILKYILLSVISLAWCLELMQTPNERIVASLRGWRLRLTSTNLWPLWSISMGSSNRLGKF
ncbi:hypothetical protein LINPERHAP1_LOCUS20296 [Linum perenne]